MRDWAIIIVTVLIFVLAGSMLNLARFDKEVDFEAQLDNAELEIQLIRS